MATHIPLMSWSKADLSEAISLFKQKMCLYLDDEGITDEVKLARKICKGIGDEGLRRLYASRLSDDDKKKPRKLFIFQRSA